MNPLLLIILDGFGIAPPSDGNAITQARMPNFKNLVRNFPHATITASGEAVGLPWQEMGNSEVGHMNLGAGRVMYQELPLINKRISDGEFYENKAFLKAIGHVQKYNSSLHLLGLCSNGGVHSNIKHLFALIEMAKLHKLKKVYIHFFTDGRDTPRKSAMTFLKQLNKVVKKHKTGQIATVAGRLYSLDRNENWDRTALAYNAIAKGEGPKFKSAEDAINHAYKQDIIDEEIKPAVITKRGNPVGTLSENDACIFFDYRPDRPKQLTKAIVLPGFELFDRGELIKNILFSTFTEYDKDLPVEVAFPREVVVNNLGEVMSLSNLRQFRISETEKYAHVTMFFNCGRIDPYRNEDRLIIPSPAVKSYDKAPEMSAEEVTNNLITVMNNKAHQFFLVNFPNPDMVGHTGNIKACIKGIEKVDELIGKLIKEIFKLNGTCIITADHGNCDEMINFQTNEPNKEHTTNPVPLIIANQKIMKQTPDPEEMSDLSVTEPIGVLGDLAPTILDIMGLEIPKHMSGISLKEMM